MLYFEHPDLLSSHQNGHTFHGSPQDTVWPLTWVKKLDPVLRQKHLAGEKMFVDFAAQAMEIIDSTTGEVCRAHILVAVFKTECWILPL